MWSRKYTNCIRCGTISIPHKSRGLCDHCYNRYYNKKYGTSENRNIISCKLILTKECLIKEYIENNKSTCDIAKETGTDRRQVSRYLKRHNIKSRSFIESRRLAILGGKLETNGKIHHLTTYKNEDYFKSWSKETAYVFGILYTDGNLYQNGNSKRISFTQKSIELPEKILKLIGCDATIFKKEETIYNGIKSGELFHFTLNSGNMYDDLINLGMTPNKSKTMKFPSSIPDEFMSHFIRGCWDGNGSVSNIKRSVNARIVSGSPDFIYSLRDRLEYFGIVEGKIYKDKNKEAYNLYYYGWRGRRLLSFIYNGSTEETRLNRKYDNYQLYLNLNTSQCDIIQSNIS